MEELLDFVTENYIWVIIISVVIVMTVIGYFADKTDFGRNSKKSKKEKNNKMTEYVPKENTIVQQVNNYDENLEQEVIPMEQSYEENVEQFVPAFDTDEMLDLNDVSYDTPVYVEDNSFEIQNNKEEVQQEEVLDKKELKRMQKEEAKRLKEEEKRLKEEEKKLKKESKKETTEEEMDNFYNDVEVPINNDVVQESSSSDLFEPMEDVSLNVENTDFDMEVETPVEDNIQMNEEPEMDNFYNEVNLSNENEPVETEMNEISEIELPSIESLDKELNDYEEEDDVWKF